MTVQIDETFAAALRAGLVEQVVTGNSKPRLLRSRRWLAWAGALLGLGAAGGGIAYAAGAWSLPGSDTVAHVAAPVTATGNGTQAVELGTPPSGTTVIDIRLTCLTAGTFSTPDGASISCDSNDLGTRSNTMSYTLPVVPGLHGTTITAVAGTRWRLTATYSTVTTSPWGINAYGKTYGVANEHGTPDLVAVIASNGDSGYVYSDQLEQAQHQGAVPEPTTPSQAVAGNGHRESILAVFSLDPWTHWLCDLEPV